MSRLANGILNHKKLVLAVVLLLTAASAFAMSLVTINYDLTDYLPEGAESTRALQVLDETFAEGIPNLNVYLPDVSIPEALDYKARFAEIPGVSNVFWLDDVADVYAPLALQEDALVDPWYRDGGALFLLTGDTGQSIEIAESVRALTDDRCVLSGGIANFSYIQGTTMDEIVRILYFAVPLVFLVLLLTTSSWFEPLLFLAAIGVAILINEGTNLFLGEISYVTRASSAVLQLAISMDYAVFLLHAFGRHRAHTANVRAAMVTAMSESFSAIAASMVTTVFGFLALVLMKFKLGPDMGVVLAKGVFVSFITVVVLLPILALYSTKLMDKTKHRSFLPSFRRFSKFVIRLRIPLALLVLLAITPSFLAQRSNEFVYGSSGMSGEGSQIRTDSDFIAETFGSGQQMVLLVPEGEPVSEAHLTDDLKQVTDITSVTSYSSAVGIQIPADYLTQEQISQVRTGGYSRFILYADTPDEGDRAFAAVDAVREQAARYYGDSYYLVGTPVVNQDLKETIVSDNLRVTLTAIASIGLVLLLTFRSLFIPLILLLTIEGAIWINLGLPYFMGASLNFIGYQIISSVQLGATVDYGILFAKDYLYFRADHQKWDAARQAIMRTTGSILTPASILAITGAALGFISTNGVISELGAILGRGALISAFMVLFFLPAQLILFDSVIRRTTLHTRFAPTEHFRHKHSRSDIHQSPPMQESVRKEDHGNELDSE